MRGNCSPPSSLLVVLVVLGSGPLCGQSVEEFDSAFPDGPAELNPPSAQADLLKVSESIVKQTNEFRAKHNLRTLSVDPRLTAAAQYFANYMARTKKYGHQADERSPSERAEEYGYDFCIVLENIAYAARSTGFDNQRLTSKFVEGWKSSQGHRKNMLDPDIYETGVAVSRSEEEPRYFAVQMFGRPTSKAIRFQVTNSAAEEVEYTVTRGNNERTFKLPPRVTRTHTQCRPSQLDLGWTDENDELAVSAGRRFVITNDDTQGLRVTIESKGLAGQSK